MKKLTRRLFISGVGVGAAGLLLSRSRGLLREPLAVASLGPVANADDFWPINKKWSSSGTYAGDDPHFAHRVLWEPDKFIAESGGLPSIVEKVNLVIVGGGMSGLIAAFETRDLHPVVLDQASRFGGNSRGGTWEGTPFPTGAVYFGKPEKDSRIEKLLNHIGVSTEVAESTDAIGIGNRLFKNFWIDVSPFHDLRVLLTNIFYEKEGYFYPKIPGDAEDLRELDIQSLKTYIETQMKVSPEVQAFIEYYSWSSFGASSSEISAASGLNFMAGEVGGLCMAPGGNADIAECLVKKLVDKVSLRPKSLVIKVETLSDGVRVIYVGADGKLSTLLAKNVIVAAPKFVAKSIVNGLPKNRIEAMDNIQYRAYLVAHVFLNAPAPKGLFDVYTLGSEGNQAPIEERSARSTDVVFANFGAVQYENRTVLCLYRSFPYEGARSKLLPVESHETFRKEFMHQIETEILPLFGFSLSQVKDVSVSRWGHAMPVSEVGSLTDGRIELIRSPLNKRISFANQDNWLMPAFEICALEAFEAADNLLGTNS